MKYYKGYLCGDYLNEEDCKKLLKIHKMSEKGRPFTGLQHIITDLDQETVEKIKREKTAENIEKTPGMLTDLQTIGVGYMYYAKRVLLGDSVGFGKTPQCAGLINLLRRERPDLKFIYFTKKTLAEKDQNELIRFTGEYVGMLHGETSKLKKELKAPVGSCVAVHSVIKNPVFQDWYMLYKEKHGVYPFDIIIIDEASSVATASRSGFTEPSKILCGSVDRVILMNATPFESRLESFRVQMELVDPSLLPKKTLFQKTFQKTRDNGQYIEYIEEYKNEQAFKDAIKLRFLARRRKNTGGTMENCTAEMRIVPKSAEQRRIEKLTTMHQMVYDCPQALDSSIQMNEETTPKLRAVRELIENEGKDEKTIMVYCRYKESQQGIIDMLEASGYDCRKLNGETKTEERLRIVEDFQQGKFRVLVTNVQEGLNFGNCNFIIFYSALPNPNKMVQVEGRITRSFDIKDKRLYLLTTKGRELKNLQDVISNRAKYSDKFVGSDYSMILELLSKARDK